MRQLDNKLVLNAETIEAKNLCDRFSEEDLNTIGHTVHMGFERDKTSRDQWETRMNAAMDLAMQIQEPKNYPWPGCSNVVFPLVTIAALQFSARSYTNLVNGNNIVRYRVIGRDEGSARDRALRIGKHMSWQVLEEDEAWEEQHDRLFINLAIVGSNFIKTYYDASRGYPVGELVLAKDLYIDYYAKSVENAARKTHRIPLYKNEIYERAARGVFRDVTKDKWYNQRAGVQTSERHYENRRRGQEPPQPDDYTPFYFLEQHTWFDFDCDGYAEPYTVTIEQDSKRVCRIVSRIEREDDVEYLGNKIIKIKPIEYFTKYSFIPSPDGGIYDLGFGVFLGPINETVNSAINQLIDAGVMQTSIGGFLGRGAKIRGGVYTMAPWEWKRVDSTGDDLKKNLVPFPDREPSDVLFKLIGLLVEYANRVAGTVDATVGENPGQNTPASTFQGMTEQGMQVFNVIFKRVWRSMKEEFKRRYEINRVYTRTHQDFGSGDDFIRLEDYNGSPDQVAPVANPRITSVVMRGMQIAAVKQDAMSTGGYDLYEVTKLFLESLEVEGIDRIYPGPGKVPPGHEFVNPKVSVEQLKVQAKEMEVKAKTMEWANHLMEDQRVNNAKIKLLEAQAMKAASEANAADAAQKIEMFEQLIKLHQEYGDMINKRIDSLVGGGSQNDRSDSDGAGVQRLEGPPRNGSDSAVSGQVSGRAQNGLGGGDV